MQPIRLCSDLLACNSISEIYLNIDKGEEEVFNCITHELGRLKGQAEVEWCAVELVASVYSRIICRDLTNSRAARCQNRQESQAVTSLSYRIFSAQTIQLCESSGTQPRDHVNNSGE